MQADQGFNEAFRPRLRMPENDSIVWSNRSWCRWNSVDQSTPTRVFSITGCINPYRAKDELHCRLNEQNDYPQQIVKVRSNRAYICRWSQEKNSPGYSFLRENFVNGSSNLFDVAGCLLRLAMWPTDLLWEKLDEIFSSSSSINASVEHLHQIGLHFRCGDIEYTGQNVGDSCVVSDPSADYKVSDKELLVDGTPVDLGMCGNNIVRELESKNREISPVYYGYIASDSPSAAKQMFDHLHLNDTVVSPKGCHIEMDKSRDCSFKTIVYWVALAMSDTLILQGRKVNKGDNFSVPSGFSRYALMYGLKSSALRFGQECAKIDMTVQSRISQGTWQCVETHHFEEGSLFRISDQKEIFVVRNRSRRSIPNWDTFTQEGFRMRGMYKTPCKFISFSRCLIKFPLFNCRQVDD